MSTEVQPAPAPDLHASGLHASDTRPVMGTPHLALAGQQVALSERSRLLRRAQASGHRLVSALYLVLDRHDASTVVTDGRVHLTCVECHPRGRAADAQFPCPTAQQAMWALDAVLG
jgi:hypothetical protein